MEAKCLCGLIHFEFTPVDAIAMNCFCSLCRRSHGADYATQVFSKKSSLVFLQGQEFLKEFSSSQFGVRAFCSECGSRLMNYAKTHSDYMSVALSSVTSTHDIQPCANVHTTSKAPWVTPIDNIPCYDQFPPDIGKYLK